MATNTPKLNLVKPETTDPVDIDVLNGNMDILDNALAPTNITTPTAGQKLVFDGTNWVNLTGYQYVDTVYYTSNGTFVKADYPWLRAIRVKVQGAGGGGGGCSATTATGVAVAAGGAGGVYAESFITDIAGLGASVTVTRGAGGAGGAAGVNSGSTGGSSSFGAIVSATGGNGGTGKGSTNLEFSLVSGTAGPTVGVGDLVIAGGSSESGGQVSDQFVIPHLSGGSHLGANVTTASSGSLSGVTGRLFGGGGSGGQNARNQGTARAGRAGANGIVIVELYA